MLKLFKAGFYMYVRFALVEQRFKMELENTLQFSAVVKHIVFKIMELRIKDVTPSEHFKKSCTELIQSIWVQTESLWQEIELKSTVAKRWREKEF